jgi:D-serine deaminase-like pyridoxal phosphate-dependent protein
MVAAGMDDVLVANEVVDPRKIARLVALARAPHRRRGGRPGARRALSR